MLFPPGNTEQNDVFLAHWTREIVPAVREAIAKDNGGHS